MKKNVIAILLIVCAAVNSVSQNIIALQHGGVTNLFTQIDSAIYHATAGDTIYLPGGVFTISGSISKPIHIVGVGHNSTYTNATNYTYLKGNSSPSFNIYLSPEASGGSISGVRIPNGLFLGNGTGCVSGYTVSRCKIGSVNSRIEYSWSCNPSGITITECIIASLGFPGGNKFTLCNNILGYIGGLGDYNIIKNNIFLSNTNNISLSGSYTTTIRNSYFENNIFLGNPFATYYSHTFDDNVFNNNLFVQNVTFPYQSTANIGINNIVNQTQNAIFVNQSGNSFSYDHDYHLQSTCPGKNAGRDGTDIGIYGGASPWKEGSIPFNPHIQTLNISPVTNSSGNLDVNIQVEAQDR